MIRSVVLLIALLTTACGEDPGAGKVVGSLSVPECSKNEPLIAQCTGDVLINECEAFDLKADFYALEPYGNSALLRIQRGGRSLALTDALTLEIRDVRLLRGALGKTQPVGLDRNIRASLGLYHLCPDSTQSFTITGLVHFDHFGTAKDDRVSGTIERLELRDARGDGAGKILGVLHGDFDFTVHRGQPYQPFSDG